MKDKLSIINSKKFSFINSVKLRASSVKLRGKFFFLICFISLLTVTLYAQEAPAVREQAAVEEPVVEEDFAMTPEKQRMELEIKTSSLPELAAWCRSLGLSEGGTREELSRRLREYLKLPEPREAANANQKVILIESAQTSEYFTIEVIDEDYARLKGEVRLTLVDKDSTHKIQADEILFNRTRNILTARGNVEYIKDKDDTIEIFRGQNITVNIDDWSSIFLDGSSIRKLGNEDTAYRFTGEVISRSEDEVTVLRKAQISNANNDEAFWSISATRVWLLPGSDFALFNAVLKVGEIPVLYIPFFFYPADDLIFHPVIGYRSREGGYVQTTTYILGRPKVNPSDSSSLSRILGSSNDMEKKHNGLFLRSTGKKVTNPDELSLKAMLDYYTNLGAYIGVDLTVPRKGILNSLDLSMGTAFSRTVTPSGNPYALKYDGTSEWNRSNFFSLDVPFRYRMNLDTSISGSYGSLALNFPYYSDPIIDKDFLNRSEYMDWFNIVQQGAVMDTLEEQRTDLQDYKWQLTGSNIRPPLNFLSPYLSNFSISSLSMTMAFKKINVIGMENSYSPSRSFFAPDKFTIYSISGSISGTPLTIGGGRQTNTITEKEEYEDYLKGIGTPRSPWPETEEETQKKPSGEKLVPPVLNQSFNLAQAGNLKFSIDYQLSPTSSTELQFRSDSNNWKSYEDVDWSEVQSILTSFSGNTSIKFGLDVGGFFTNSFTFAGNATFRDYKYLNDEAEAYLTSGNPDPDKIEEAKRQQYSQTNYSTSYAYSGSIRPLYKNSIFGQSNIQYSFSGTLVESKKYEDGDGPELAPQWGGWVKEETKDGKRIPGLKTHQLSTYIAANVLDNVQSITFNSDLPPLDPLFSLKILLKAWISDTSMDVQFKKPAMIDNVENSKWITDPFRFNETLRIGKIGSFTFNMTLDPEKDNEITNISSSLTLWDFRASFSAAKTKKWEFMPDNPDNPSMGGKWAQKEDSDALFPRDLTLSYAHNFRRIDIIKNRLFFSVNLSSNLYFDLQRYTNSNFRFSLGFTLGINGFLDLSLSATSDNNVIWRYFKNFPGLEEATSMYIEGKQNNVFIDLFDSFNFADEAKRKGSGFKMKSFNLTLNHYLGDWTASLGVVMSPYLNIISTPPKYELNAEISFLVKWTAISEIKTDMKYEKKTETWTKK